MPLRAYSSANAHAENILGNMLRMPMLRTYLGIILLLQLIRLHRSICAPNSLAIYGGISSHLIIIRFFACCLLNIRCTCSGFYRLNPTESACLRCGTINTVSAGTCYRFPGNVHFCSCRFFNFERSRCCRFCFCTDNR